MLLSPGGGFSRPARLCLMGGFPPGAYIHHSAGPKSQRFFLRKRRPRFLIHARRGRKKTRFFFAGRFFAARAGTPTRRPEPVSYTHLDVYKRQQLQDAKDQVAATKQALLDSGVSQEDVAAGGKTLSNACLLYTSRRMHFATFITKSTKRT